MKREREIISEDEASGSEDETTGSPESVLDLDANPQDEGRVFCCRFPGCGKSYASTDGVRKHCRKQHSQWLHDLDEAAKGSHTGTLKSELYCLIRPADDAERMPRKRARPAAAATEKPAEVARKCGPCEDSPPLASVAKDEWETAARNDAFPEDQLVEAEKKVAQLEAWLRATDKCAISVVCPVEPAPSPSPFKVSSWQFSQGLCNLDLDLDLDACTSDIVSFPNLVWA